MKPSFRDIAQVDIGAVLRLNDTFVHFLSPLDEEGLQTLLTVADYGRVAVFGGEIVGFLIGFLPGAAYDSVNYRWFDSRFDDFAYIDRIVVSREAQGRSLGRLFYDDFSAFAKLRSMKRLACEYYSVPLNEGSARFHTRYGFTEIGQQSLDSGKSVSLQTCTISL